MSHQHYESDKHIDFDFENHIQTTQIGLIATLGIFSFFISEKLFSMISTGKKAQQVNYVSKKKNLI